MVPVPPLRVDATHHGLRLDDGVLQRALTNLAPGAPIIVMIHGYRHEPGHPLDCPHVNILSATPGTRDRRVVSWPSALGLDGRTALALAFGWPAKGTIWGAYTRAGLAGLQLALLIETLPSHHPVQIIAHSFGARVALRAISLLPAGRVNRVILLAAAELRRPARAAMARATATDVINVCTQDNWLYDTGLSWVIGAGVDCGLGRGLGREFPRWLNLRIDQGSTRATLSDLGLPVAAAQLRICHWSAYLRPGAFTLYRSLLTGALPLPILRARLSDPPSAPLGLAPDGRFGGIA